MTREITVEVQDAVQANHVVCMLFVELDFVSGFVRACGAPKNKDWDAKTWTGFGLLGDASPVQESVEIGARGVELTLSGVPPETAALAAGEHYQGRPARIWYGPLDDNHQVIPDPVLIFRGRIDDMTISLGASSSITVRLENRLADLYRPRVRRWNDADQRARYPDDRGLEFVATLPDQRLTWGPYTGGPIVALKFAAAPSR